VRRSSAEEGGGRGEARRAREVRRAATVRKERGERPSPVGRGRGESPLTRRGRDERGDGAARPCHPHDRDAHAGNVIQGE